MYVIYHFSKKCNWFRRLAKQYGLATLVVSCLLQACYVERFSQATHTPTHHPIQPLAFQYLTLTTSIQGCMGENSYKIRVQFRIQQGKLIWFSAMAPWGLEIARGIISPTEIRVINHLQRSYTVYDYPTLQTQWHCPCSYGLIQAILLGELPYPYSGQLSIQPELLFIQVQKGTWEIKATRHSRLGKIERLIVVDQLTQDQCKIKYQQFKPYQAGFIWEAAQLYIGNLLLDMRHISIYRSDKPLDFPFTIPWKYAQS